MLTLVRLLIQSSSLKMDYSSVSQKMEHSISPQTLTVISLASEMGFKQLKTSFLTV